MRPSDVTARVFQEYMERLRKQKSTGVKGDRTFDFLAANVAKVERQERRQLDAVQNGEQVRGHVQARMRKHGSSIFIPAVVRTDASSHRSSWQ